MMTRQQAPEWSVLQFINDNFEVVWIEDNAESIDGVDVLLLVAPQNISEPLEYAIDQYVLSGGKALVFVDPHVETMASMGGMPSVQPSNLARLMSSWGVTLSEEEFIADFANSMVVTLGQGQQPVRHLGLLSLRPDALAEDDVVVFGLESLNLSTAGALSLLEGATTKLTPMIQSSDQSQLMASEVLATVHNPATLLSDFIPTGERYVLAGRISGPAKTAFPDGIEITEELATDIEGDQSSDATDEVETETVTRQLTPSVLENDDINVMVVADSDVLSDRLWVQVQNFFGQRIASPWADNGALLVNLADHLGGSADLISLRARGQYSRPFERVNTLRRDAEQQFLASEQRLQIGRLLAQHLTLRAQVEHQAAGQHIEQHAGAVDPLRAQRIDQLPLDHVERRLGAVHAGRHPREFEMLAHLFEIDAQRFRCTYYRVRIGRTTEGAGYQSFL